MGVGGVVLSNSAASFSCSSVKIEQKRKIKKKRHKQHQETTRRAVWVRDKLPDGLFFLLQPPDKLQGNQMKCTLNNPKQQSAVWHILNRDTFPLCAHLNLLPGSRLDQK